MSDKIPDNFTGMFVPDTPEEDPESFMQVPTEDPESFMQVLQETPTSTPPSSFPPNGPSPATATATAVSSNNDDIVSANIPEAMYPPDMKLDVYKDWSTIVLPNDLMDLALKENMYPQEGFLPKYIRWAEGTTDAPRPFHLVGGLAVLSSVLGPNWTTAFAGGQHTNFYALLIAGSGSRKSTALRRALSLIPDELICSSTLASTPAFVKTLQDRKRMLWYLDEADSLFSTFQQKYGNDLSSRMVTAYDNEPTIYSSLTQGDIIAPKPYLSLVTGTALEWLKERKLSANLLRGGLISRFWLIPAKRSRLLLMPSPPDPNTTAAMKLWIDDVYRISNLDVRFDVQLSPSALKLFLQYQAGRGEASHADMSGIWNRSMDHIARIALLFHVSCYRRGQDRIQEDSMQQAINLWHNYLLRGHYWAVMNLVATDDPVKEFEQEILTQLEMSAERCLGLAELYSGRSFKMFEGLFNLYLRRRIRFWACRTGGKGRPKFVVTLGQEPTGFVQCEKRVPQFIQRGLDHKGIELSEIDFPYPSGTWDSSSSSTGGSDGGSSTGGDGDNSGDTSVITVSSNIVGDTYNEVLEAVGWEKSEEILDSDGSVISLCQSPEGINATWDGEYMRTWEYGSVLVPGVAYDLTALKQRFAAAAAGQIEPVKKTDDLPLTWDIRPMTDETEKGWEPGNIKYDDDGWVP